MLIVLHVLSHLTLKIALWARCYYAHFTDKEIKWLARGLIVVEPAVKQLLENEAFFIYGLLLELFFHFT